MWWTPWQRRVIRWCFLCVIVDSLTGVSPFRGRTTDETYLNITQATSASLSSPAWQSVSDYAKDWISKLLVKDSKKRMTVSDALAHPWLNVSSANAFHWRRFSYFSRFVDWLSVLLLLRYMGLGVFCQRRHGLEQSLIVCCYFIYCKNYMWQ